MKGRHGAHAYAGGPHIVAISGADASAFRPRSSVNRARGTRPILRFRAPSKGNDHSEFQTVVATSRQLSYSKTSKSHQAIGSPECLPQCIELVRYGRKIATKSTNGPAMKVRLMTVVGARPQFIKAAAVSRALAARDNMTEIIVHTGQHFDNNMSKVFFDELDIPTPAYDLEVHGGSHGDMTGRMLSALEDVMLKKRPDWVMVYGDTNSTLAGALAAAKVHIPVAHVEAGLRSFNRRMPEEINRVLVDHLSTLLLCPTAQSVANLAREGITGGVHHVGDVMYDATKFAAVRAREVSTVLEDLNLTPEGYAVATLHRAECTDDPARLKAAIDWLSERAEESHVVFPVHPRTRAALAQSGIEPRGLRIIEPVGYLDMARLLDGAVAVYTDSGGLQKEAYFHRKPCVTLRSETEWTELVEAGWNRLWTEPDYLHRTEIKDYGDGCAAELILDHISGHSGASPGRHS